MAFEMKNLCLIAAGGDMGVYSYTTADTQTIVKAADYFNPAASQLRAGDRIMVRCSKDGTATHHDVVVASSGSGKVIVTALTVL